MQIVIEIPENTYRQIQALVRNGYFDHDICGNSMRRIANGTPLPKGHGRLIDADKYRKDMQESREFNFFATLDFQQTIIEADKEQEHDN